jgi:hypothetical protein
VKEVRLSASRIETFLMCSWLYYAKYTLKIPDKSNDGARRGTITHLILEVLLNPRHRKHYDDIMAARSCKGSNAVWRLIVKKAMKEGICDDQNVDLIDDFILVGLSHNFFGDSITDTVLSEEIYEFKVNEGGKKYFIVAKIDKIFVKKHGGGIFIEIVDYKTSKVKFEGNKINWNIQEFVYTLAAKKMFPDAKGHELSFLFLKFPKSPVVSSTTISALELDGFEYYLTDMQSLLEGFGRKQAESNFAALKGYPKPEEGFCGLLKCGYAKEPGQLKKDGSLMYHCEAKFPFSFYAVKKGDKIVRSAFEKEDLVIKDGEKLVKKRYKGCKYFNRENYR